jgi:endonuclease/exonuclease/phosphatase family metal-dependent hydrolase
MKFTRLFKIVTPVLLVVFFSEISLAQIDEPMRVMSYNVRYKNTIDSINGWDFRKDNVAALIKYHKADIVGLQESNDEQTADMEERLKDYGWYGVPRMSGKTGEMTPVFYRKHRFTLLDSGTFWYSETPDVPESKSWDAMYPRIASWVKLRDLTSGREFFFFNTHFDHRGEISRQRSGEIIRQKIVDIAGFQPVILTGDFNTQEGSEAYRNIVKEGTLKDAFHITESPHYGPANTSSGFAVSTKPIGARIDYIFVNEKVRVLEHATITDQQEGRYYSDHLPVIAEVSFIK